MKYVGLQNFAELSKDSAFWGVAVKNTMKIIFIGGFFVFGIGFLISGLLATKIKGRKFMRALIFLPAILNPIAVAILWSFIYNYRWGLLNNMLRAIGLDSLAMAWTSPETMFGAILVALVWTYTGFYCVIILAALDRIPESHIEAAKLDGASEFQTFFRIKLPMIRPVLSTAVTLWVITAVKEFALLFAWGGGVDVPPAGATNLAVRMFITAFGRRVTIYRMGYATAMGVIMFLIVAVSVWLVYRLLKSDELEY
jgi:ABC-type sugar transport system permease subunit